MVVVSSVRSVVVNARATGQVAETSDPPASWSSASSHEAAQVEDAAEDR